MGRLEFHYLAYIRISCYFFILFTLDEDYLFHLRMR